MRSAFEPTWDSLLHYQVPEWILDAKFGIYAHWGVYSVPAFGNEWYAKRMYEEGSAENRHFVSTYGPLSKVGYKDLVPKFTAAKFDPEEWADLYAGSGARYGGIALVHHDGFLLWDSQLSRWNAANMGPKRDVYGELARELRTRGLRTAATFHHFRSFNWYLPGSGGMGELDEGEGETHGRTLGWDLYDPTYADLYWNRHTGIYSDFVAEWQAKLSEAMDKYEPELIWFDGGHFDNENARHTVSSLLAHYLNASSARGQDPVVLNKLSVTMTHNFPRDFGVLTFEQGRDRPPNVERPWIDDLNIAKWSWGYVEGQEYRSPTYVLHSLIDTVSRGGGLLLSLAPKADGTIPEPQARVLRQVGEWLSVSGESIYGTRAWNIHAEGDVHKLWSGRLGVPWTFDGCDASDIRFTRKGHTIYAIALGWPNEDKLRIVSLRNRTSVGAGGIASVELLGHAGRLKWWRHDAGLDIQLPPEKPHDHAYAFRIRTTAGSPT